jgi:putative hydrolase of the HAD superfamily
LRAQGISVGLISNWDRRLRRIFDGLGLMPMLDTVVSSAEVGLRKPDPRIFELACARVGAEPSECAHVGDHEYADIIGAEAVGMQAVLIDRHGGTAPQRELFVRTLDELDGVLGLEE